MNSWLGTDHKPLKIHNWLGLCPTIITLATPLLYSYNSHYNVYVNAPICNTFVIIYMKLHMYTYIYLSIHICKLFQYHTLYYNPFVAINAHSPIVYTIESLTATHTYTQTQKKQLHDNSTKDGFIPNLLFSFLPFQSPHPYFPYIN